MPRAGRRELHRLDQANQKSCHHRSEAETFIIDNSPIPNLSGLKAGRRANISFTSSLKSSRAIIFTLRKCGFLRCELSDSGQQINDPLKTRKVGRAAAVTLSIGPRPCAQQFALGSNLSFQSIEQSWLPALLSKDTLPHLGNQIGKDIAAAELDLFVASPRFAESRRFD